MREDTFTSTVDAAAAYEAARGYGLGPDYGMSPAEIAREADLDRREDERRERRDAEARARGEKVPSPSTRMAANLLDLTLVMGGLPRAAVNIYDDGVYWVSGVSDIEHEVWSKIDRDKFEIKVADGIVWIREVYQDPWFNESASGTKPF